MLRILEQVEGGGKHIIKSCSSAGQINMGASTTAIKWRLIEMRRKMLHNAKLVIRVESDRIAGKIRTVSIFDNRTQEYWNWEQIKERGCEWFTDQNDLKETLNWNLNGDSAKYQFKWGHSTKKKSEGIAYIYF